MPTTASISIPHSRPVRHNQLVVGRHCKPHHVPVIQEIMSQSDFAYFCVGVGPGGLGDDSDMGSMIINGCLMWYSTDDQLNAWQVKRGKVTMKVRTGGEAA